MQEQIRVFLRRIDITKDLLAVIGTAATVYGVMLLLTSIFGYRDVPIMGMGYITKGFMGISLLAIFMTGAWVLMGLFFPSIRRYFTDPDGLGEKKSKFVKDIVSIQTGDIYNKQCVFRLLFHLLFYFVFLLVEIMSAKILF
jgi:hypothetical protein